MSEDCNYMLEDPQIALSFNFKICIDRKRVLLRLKCPLLSSRIVNWTSLITKFRLSITRNQGSLLLWGQYDFNLSSVAVLASDLKSEVKLREKREISIHKRKMLCFTGLYTFDPSINQRSLWQRRLSVPIIRDDKCALIELLQEYTLLNRRPPAGAVVT